MVEGTQVSSGVRSAAKPTTAEIIDRLSHFDGPPEHFLLNLLAVQCHLSSASGGAILRPSQQGQPEVLAVYPPMPEGTQAPAWLAQAAEAAPEVMTSGKSTVRPLHDTDSLYGAPARVHLLLVPLSAQGNVRGLAAFVIEARDPSALALIADRLELTTSLLSLYEMRLTLQRRQVDLRRLRLAMETLSAVNEQDKFASSAMTFCNEVASRWTCQRVSLGFLKGRYVQLKATSHTEKFSRKMKLVQDIESAMEECIDQDVEVVYPAGTDATFVSRTTSELATRYGPSAVASLPLRRAGEPVGVVTVERLADKPFALDEMESLRLTCDLITARMHNLFEHDRWVGAKLAHYARKGAAVAVGPKHTWIKLLVIGLCVGLGYILFAKGDYQAEAPFAMEATQRQVVVAPFDGFLLAAPKEPGNSVAAGEVLAELKTDELKNDLESAKAEYDRYMKEAAAAQAQSISTSGRPDEGALAKSQIARLQAAKAMVQAKLIELKISQAKILSPLEGDVLTGDLKRTIGIDGPVKAGQQLIEVAPRSSLRADLAVPEDQVADIRAGYEGELATTADPSRRIKFRVERINPVAEVVQQANVFKVRVHLEGVDLNGADRWLRPGMEGVAKIKLGEKTYAWLWTRRLVNWVRMKLWI